MSFTSLQLHPHSLSAIVHLKLCEFCTLPIFHLNDIEYSVSFAFSAMQSLRIKLSASKRTEREGKKAIRRV